MATYEFDLHMNRALSDAQELIVLGRIDGVSPVSGPGDAGHLMCTVDGDSLADAVASTAAELHALLPSIWATGLGLDDTVSLREAARRTGGTRGEQSLRLLALGERGPGGFPEAVVTADRYRLYSWAQVAGYLRTTMGDDIAAVDTKAVLVDRLLAARAATHAAQDDGIWEQFGAA